MKNPWNDMILLLPLQEFMSLTSVQGKLRASAPCLIFYVDSLHAAWILHQVPPKLLHTFRIDGGPRAQHSTGQPFVKSDFHISSKCAFV
ncbi:hypothetical protein B296_00003977 [Ensete ventricosum]|uniref:Uncharacterized protein n=1 Tax=Ensete ventricosum TaxID=4639 RepID=A0A426ZFR1_ENSVE|nr:hypothetical protein B296_00003977 [Ensete ventricosum]